MKNIFNDLNGNILYNGKYQAQYFRDRLCHLIFQQVEAEFLVDVSPDFQ